MTEEYTNRRTFAIISHPDAGKTTLTEKLLLFGGAIKLAGTVKGRKASRHATSDWMEMEKQRGISVSTSVMQFGYKDTIINLLDTPGHEDFSEDTYRTLTAVDSALMVIDAVKGVEERTIKLMEVCRLRQTPITTFVNKLDRNGLSPIELLDEIESVLNIKCAPVTWPLGMGKEFKGVYHLLEDRFYLFSAGKNDIVQEARIINGLGSTEAKDYFGENLDEFKEELELVLGASHSFVREDFLAGNMTPVYFGSAINNFGIEQVLDSVAEYAPSPLSRFTTTREVKPSEKEFTGFVFKIQANMDLAHRDRIAFMRVCSGSFNKGQKLYQVRTKKQLNIANALTFMAGEREHLSKAYPGDIIGLHNHGTIQIGDTFTSRENLKFTGIPNFAPELFKVVRTKDPLKSKALQKGLLQLSEEGATQVFRAKLGNKIILGAVGVLQFDVVAERLKTEYKVECVYDSTNVVTARWVECDNKAKLREFVEKNEEHLSLDHTDSLIYLATSRVNMDLTIERWPDIIFRATREV